MADAVIIAAPSSAAGKTVVTLALLRALARRGVVVASAKVGPDYIDPRFHAAASGRECVNLDPWAMRRELLSSLLARLAEEADLIVIEGVMGLFDGAAAGAGSTADLAAALRLPVVLVVDCSHQAQSVAALVHGFRHFRRDVTLAGVILNQVASPRHRTLIEAALAATGVDVIGALERVDSLLLPARHLGLVQAQEHDELEDFLERAAACATRTLDLDRLAAIARPVAVARPAQLADIVPLGRRIALAEDIAFAFTYPHLIAAWRDNGVDIVPFSPLADEPPDTGAEAVLLPGGYPELHAERLAGNRRFLSALAAAADRGVTIYGECGGYMVLGEAIIDAEGISHTMAGLLPLVTSFAARRLHLGYRRLQPRRPSPFAASLRGHEFHYTTARQTGPADVLFDAFDSAGEALGACGLRRANVMGSYAHVIDLAED